MVPEQSACRRGLASHSRRTSCIYTRFRQRRGSFIDVGCVTEQDAEIVRRDVRSASSIYLRSSSVLGLAPKMPNSVHCRGIQLAAGRTPKARALTFVQLNNRHWSAKVNYGMEIRKIFFAFSTWHLMGFSAAMTQFRAATECYLRHEAYLLGCLLDVRYLLLRHISYF